MSDTRCPRCGEISGGSAGDAVCARCGAGVDASAGASAGPPRPRLVRPGRPAERRETPPRRARPASSFAERAREHEKTPFARNPAVLGAALVGVAAALWFLFGRGDRTPERPPSAPAPVASTSGTAAAPPAVAPASAAAGTSAPEPAETGSREYLRLVRLMKDAQSADEWMKAATYAEEQAAKDGSDKDETAKFRERVALCLDRALAADPDSSAVRARLGHVRFAEAEARSWIASDLVPRRLKATLETALDEAGDAAKAGWLKGDAARRWGEAVEAARVYTEDRATPGTRFIYDRAGKNARRIENEIGRYLIRDGSDTAFQAVVLRPQLVLVQKDPSVSPVDRAYEIVLLFRSLLATWRAKFGDEVPLAPPLLLPPVVFLHTEADYARYLQRHEQVVVTSAGHYEHGERRIFVYASEEHWQRTVIFHEGTHMLFDLANTNDSPEAQSRQSMWFSEGIAEYFGGHGATGETDPASGLPVFEPGRINTTRIDSMALAMKANRLIPFRDLLSITREQWGADHKTKRFWSELTYAQGWALVYFLNHFDGGRYAKDFLGYMKEELKGESGVAAFSRVFGRHDLERVGKEYFEYLAYIIEMHGKGRIRDGKIVD